MPIPATLRTARLLMRPWSPDDAEAVLPVLAANVGRLERWIPAQVAAPVPLPQLRERLAILAADFAEERAFRWALFTPDGARVLGEASLFARDAEGRVPLPDGDRVEVGYWLEASATGQGIATEATRALLDVAASLPGMTHVEIRCAAENVASAAIPRRLGFTLEAEVDGDQLWRLPLPGVPRDERR